MSAEPSAGSRTKRLEQRIAELERSVLSFERRNTYFEMLIRSLPGVFYVIEDNLKFQSWNKNLERVTGYASEDLVTKTVMEMFVGEDARRIREAIRKALDRCLGNRTRAAKMLGISRKTLMRKLKRLERG